MLDDTTVMFASPVGGGEHDNTQSTGDDEPPTRQAMVNAGPTLRRVWTCAIGASDSESVFVIQMTKCECCVCSDQLCIQAQLAA